MSAQDGPLPPEDNIQRHEDSEAYRHAAIRECFEESGLLLARDGSIEGALLDLSDEERDRGRKEIHAEETSFQIWVEQRNAAIDIQGLVPFTRWLTPSDVPKRFSTQMYLYFLPLLDSSVSSRTDKATQMHIPTPDGGIEHTAARFLYPQEWLDLARNGEIILYPPQFFLLSIIAPFLYNPSSVASVELCLEDQRKRLLHFVHGDGDPPWGEKCISPNTVGKIGKYLIMGLANPGPELADTDRTGDTERVIKIELSKDMDSGRGRRRPQPCEVAWRRDILRDNGVKL